MGRRRRQIAEAEISSAFWRDLVVVSMPVLWSLSRSCSVMAIRKGSSGLSVFCAV